jgi:hypothetical protein
LLVSLVAVAEHTHTEHSLHWEWLAPGLLAAGESSRYFDCQKAVVAASLHPCLFFNYDKQK